MRRALAPVALVAVASLGGGAAWARTVERIVAVVNEEIILQSELEERVAPIATALEHEEPNAQLRERRLRGIRREVLDRLVDEQLILEQARELKVVVGTEEVDRAIEDVRRTNHLDDEQLTEALRQQGYSYAGYRQDLRRQIIRLKVVNIAVRSRVQVSDEDVKTFYNQSVRGISDGSGGKVHARHIFIEVPEGASAAVGEQKRKQAGELVARARAGEDFAALASRYSEDPATKGEGGDLGTFGRGVLPKEIEEIVFAMEPGEIRGPVRTPQGFHVILVVERAADGARPLDEVKEQIRNQLYQQELEKQTKVWLGELRKKAHVDVRL